METGPRTFTQKDLDRAIAIASGRLRKTFAADLDALRAQHQRELDALRRRHAADRGWVRAHLREWFGLPV